MSKKLKCDGKLCNHSGENCNTLGPDDYICTRKKGHKGPHIACGHASCNYAIWENETDKEQDGTD